MTMDLSALPNKELVILYNDCAEALGRTLVNKFTDRATALRRVAAIQGEMPVKAVVPTPNGQETTTMSDFANDEADAQVAADVKAQAAEAKAAAKAQRDADKAAAAEARAAERAAAKEAKDADKAAAAEAKAAAKAAKDAEREAAKAAGPEAGTVRGRASANSGKRLFPVKDSNPRRPGSHGFRSLQLIHDEPGLTYEDFVERGGRNVDLQWDLVHGNARSE